MSSVQSNRGVAQPGSAPGLGPGGRRFESCRPDLNNDGVLTERLGNGLQNRVERFDSARHLNKKKEPDRFLFFVFICLAQIEYKQDVVIEYHYSYSKANRTFY